MTCKNKVLCSKSNPSKKKNAEFGSLFSLSSSGNEPISEDFQSQLGREVANGRVHDNF